MPPNKLVPAAGCVVAGWVVDAPNRPPVAGFAVEAPPKSPPPVEVAAGWLVAG